MKLFALLSVSMALLVVKAQHTYIPPYNGGDQFHNLHTNPAYLNTLLGNVQTTVGTECDEIAGVGFPILSLKKAIQDIDTQLDSTNSNSYAKVIFFKETASSTQNTTTYKVVLMIKTFLNTNYLGVSGVYKKIGFPTFSIENYLFDSNIENIRTIMEESYINENGVFGCGDVKSIYSQANPVLPNPNTIIGGQQSNPSQEPYAQGNQIINSQANGNPTNANVITEILKLLAGTA